MGQNNDVRTKFNVFDDRLECLRIYQASVSDGISLQRTCPATPPLHPTPKPTMLLRGSVLYIALAIVCNIRDAMGCSSQPPAPSLISATGVTEPTSTVAVAQGDTEAMSGYRNVGYYPVSQ
jgi:hypothetical protein